jgi:hypothetical protein
VVGAAQPCLDIECFPEISNYVAAIFKRFSKGALPNFGIDILLTFLASQSSAQRFDSLG